MAPPLLLTSSSAPYLMRFSSGKNNNRRPRIFPGYSVTVCTLADPPACSVRSSVRSAIMQVAIQVKPLSR